MKRQRTPKGKGTGGGRGSVASKRAREADTVEHAHAAGASAASSAHPRESVLVKLLLHSWSWGFISLVFLQKICMAAVLDFEAVGAAPPRDLVAFASIGGSGSFPANMRRDVNDILPEIFLGRPADIYMPLRSAKGVVINRMQSIIFPHVLFANIYTYYKEAWSSKVLPSTDSLRGFWDAMTGHPLIDIVRTREGGFRDNLVPLALHGDDVPVTGVGKSWQKLITVFSWYVLLTVLFVLYLFFIQGVNRNQGLPLVL